MARNMHKYEELTPYEFDREKERASIVYVAAGPLEYHEECNILGLDTNKGYDWCLAAAEVTGGIVFPMLPIAPAGHRPHMSKEQLRAAHRPHMDKEKLRQCYKLPRYREEYAEGFGSLYPSMFFSREACYPVYEELLEMLADEMQFKVCMFVGSHSPASELIKEIVAHANGTEPPAVHQQGVVYGDFHGMRVIAASSQDYSDEFLTDFHKKNGIPKAFHGGMWEMALNYAINPDYYHPEYLDETKYPQHFGALREDYTEKSNRPTKSEFRKFTPEFAKQIREVTIQNMIADVQRNYKEVTEKE